MAQTRRSALQDAAAIVGIGQTEFTKQIDRPESQLACEAVVAALRDAGIAPSEVDGLSSFTMETTDEVTMAKNIGAGDVTYFSQVGYGGGAGCATVGHAAMAIATGQADVVVAWRSRKRGGRDSRPWATAPSRLPIQAQWTRPFGLLRPVDEVAMLTRRYLHEYGGGREALAEVATAIRAHANRNPAALMYEKPMTVEDYMAARYISEPLGLFDNCLETDGALAVVLVSAERAKDCPHPPALVHAFAQGLHRQHESMVNYYCEDPLTGPAWACAEKLWSQSELGPADVDVAQIYDAFTPLILLSLEGYGFCGRGEAGDFVLEGNLRWGSGSLPTNTSGGGLSEAYVHGFNLITEGVRQLRGTSTSQVDGARTSLVTSGEGVPTSAILLRAPD
jgi:acetyl-CoA acetyltransferase